MDDGESGNYSTCRSCSVSITFSCASALVMTTSQVPVVAPIPPLEIVEGVEDGLLGVVAERHQERLDAPRQQQLPEQRLVIGEGVNRHAHRAQRRQRVGQEAAAREHDDAGVSRAPAPAPPPSAASWPWVRSARSLRSCRRISGRLDALQDVLHHLDAFERIQAGGGFAGQHHRIGALANGVGDIGNLGARRHRRGDHRFQQMRGDDHRLAFGQAQIRRSASAPAAACGSRSRCRDRRAPP